LLVVRFLPVTRASKPRREIASGAGAMTVLVLVVGVVLGAWGYQACDVYDRSLLLPAANDAGPSDAAVDVDPCPHARPPPRPEAAAATDGGTFQVVAAFESIDIGLTADAGAPRPPYGYDLDGVCTCPGPPSCTPTNDADCDDEVGRDNIAIDLFRGLGVAASTGTSQINEGLTTGQYGLLLVIDDYNGEANDPNVTVSYYVSNGDRAADGGIQRPAFTGLDRWTIDPNSLAGTPTDIPSCANNRQCQALFSDDQAYVANNEVVANFSGNQIPVAFGDRSFLGGATILLSSAVIVGTLQKTALATPGFGYVLTAGTIAGRWSSKDLLSTLATIPDPAVDGGFLCSNILNYNIIKAAACGAVDISQNPHNDNTPAPCDAVSVGMRFTAGPAQLGGVYRVPPAPAGCAVGGLPFTDSCN
jgi:hypothetical protein